MSQAQRVRRTPPHPHPSLPSVPLSLSTPPLELLEGEVGGRIGVGGDGGGGTRVQQEGASADEMELVDVDLDEGGIIGREEEDPRYGEREEAHGVADLVRRDGADQESAEQKRESQEEDDMEGVHSGSGGGMGMIPEKEEVRDSDMLRMMEDADEEITRRTNMLKAKFSANPAVRIWKKLGRNIIGKAGDVGIGLMGVGEGIADTGGMIGKTAVSGVGAMSRIGTSLSGTHAGGAVTTHAPQEIDTETDVDITGTILRDLNTQIETQRSRGANSAESPFNTMWILLIFPIMPLAIMYTKVVTGIFVPPLWGVAFSVWTFFGWRFWMCLTLVVFLTICISWNTVKEIGSLRSITMRIEVKLIAARKEIGRQRDKSLPKIYKAFDRALPYLRNAIHLIDRKMTPKLGYSPVTAIWAKANGWIHDPSHISGLRHSEPGTDISQPSNTRDGGSAQIVAPSGITSNTNLEFSEQRTRPTSEPSVLARAQTSFLPLESGADPSSASIATVPGPVALTSQASHEGALEDEVYEKYYFVRIRLRYLAELHRKYSSVFVEWTYRGMVVDRSVIRAVEESSQWTGYGTDFRDCILEGEVKFSFHPKELSPDGNDLVLADTVFDDVPLRLVLKGRDGMPLYSNDGARRYMRESAKVCVIGEINMSSKKIGIGQSISGAVRSELRVPLHAIGSSEYRTAVLYCSTRSTPVDASSYSYRQMLSELPNGEWTIRVNIFELRNLSALDESGASDPYVLVSTMSQRKMTDCYRKTLSCMVNQMLFFSRVCSGLEFENEKIEVAVMDWNRFGMDQAIGVYTFDAKRILELPGHEVYRKWFALHNPRRNKHPGGFIKLSITVVPPGGMPPRHEETEDREEFTAAVLLKNTIIKPPPMTYSNWAVHITVGWADMLPEISGHTDRDVVRGYVQFAYTGFPSLETKTFIAKAREIIDPNITDACRVLPQRRAVWNEEYILPLSIINNRVTQEGIQLRLYHRRSLPEVSAPLLIGQVSISFRELFQNKCPSIVRGQSADDENPGDRVVETAMLRPSYYNFYGKPLGNADIYDKGVAYRGRILIGVAAKPRNIVEPFLRPCLPPPRPRLQFYKMNFSVLRATELSLKDGWIVYVECRIGLYSFGHTIPKSAVRNNCVKWDQNCSVSIPNMQFPEDIGLIPDLFITLWARMPKTVPVLDEKEKFDSPGDSPATVPTGDAGQTPDSQLNIGDQTEDNVEIPKSAGSASSPSSAVRSRDATGDRVAGENWKPKAFLRLPAKHLILNVGETRDHEWMFMDYPSNDLLQTGTDLVPGSLLVHASLSRYDPTSTDKEERDSAGETGAETIAVFADEADNFGGGVANSTAAPAAENGAASVSENTQVRPTGGTMVVPGTARKYELRALIYRGRSLPAADDSGMSDPFIIVSMGNQKKTGNTTCKSTIAPLWNDQVILKNIIVRDAERKPNINVMIYDDNEEDNPDYLGRAIIPCSELDDRPPSLEYAKWYPVFSVNPGVSVGEILADFQLIPHEIAVVQPPSFPSHVPTKSALRISVVGLRDVKFLQYASGTMFVEVTVSGDPHKRSSKRGAILQQRAYQANCGILDVLILPIDIPGDLRLAPALNVCVFADLNHMRKHEVVATATIPLEDFLHEHERKLITGENLVDDSFGMDEPVRGDLLKKYKFRKKARRLKGVPGESAEEPDHDGTSSRARLHEIKSATGIEQKAINLSEDGSTQLLRLGFPVEQRPSKFVLQMKALVAQLQEGVLALAHISSAVRSLKYFVANLLADIMPDVAMALGIEAEEDEVPLSSLVDDHTGDDDEIDYDGTRMLKRERGFCPYELELDFCEPAYGEFFLFRGDNRGLGNTTGRMGNDYVHTERNPRIPPLIPLDEGKTKEQLLAVERRRAALRGTRPPVGKLKARLDLVEVDTEDELELSKVRLASLRSFGRVFIPTEVVVRVYILRGLALQQVSGKCNPYLHVRFYGGYPDAFSQKHNPVENDATPNFFQCFESTVKMPGGSVRIEVKDRMLPELTLPLKTIRQKETGLFPFGIADLDVPLKFGKLGFGWSETIGETVIDLDSRWYNSAWRSLKKTPIECRALYGDESVNQKGQLELFVDIFDAQDVERRPKLYKPVPIAPPKQEEYEIRLVLYKIRDVMLPYKLADYNPVKLADFYVKVKLGNNEEDERCTDKCKYVGDGLAEFMWRMKWDLKLPSLDLKPRLKLQVFDDTSAGIGNDQLCAVCDIKLRSLLDELVAKKKIIIRKKQWVIMKHPNHPDVEARAQISLELLPKKEAMKKVCFTGKDAYLKTDKQHEDYFLPVPFQPAPFSIMNPAPYFTYLITSTLMNLQAHVATALLIFPFVMVILKFAWLTPWSWYFAGGCCGAVIFVRIMLVQGARYARMQAEMATARQYLEEDGG